MRTQHIAFFTLLLAATVVMSCENVFEADDNTIVTSADIVRSGYPGARLVVQGSYERFIDVMDNVTYACAIATENADETDSYQGSGDIDMGQFHSGLTEGNTMYSGLHDARNQADLFLTEYVDQFDFADQLPADAPSAARRKQTFVAFAKLVRGWSTLYLGLVFREVNFNRGPRESADAAIQRAMTDFQEVDAMYDDPVNPPEATWINIDIRRAANTLLAKAELQLHQYSNALAAAAKGLQKTDPAAQREVSGPYDNPLNGMAMFTAGFADAFNARTRISMNKFFIGQDSLDERINLLSTTADGATNITFGANDRQTFYGYQTGWTAPLKLSKYFGETTAETPIRVLSWQENALISAEAKIMSGDVPGGVADINSIRMDVLDDAGNPVPLASAATQAAALAALEYEIRMEFAVECGEYFTALRRWGRTHYFRAGALYQFEIPTTE